MKHKIIHNIKFIHYLSNLPPGLENIKKYWILLIIETLLLPQHMYILLVYFCLFFMFIEVFSFHFFFRNCYYSKTKKMIIGKTTETGK